MNEAHAMPKDDILICLTRFGVWTHSCISDRIRGRSNEGLLTAHCACSARVGPTTGCNMVVAQKVLAAVAMADLFASGTTCFYKKGGGL